jgi:hypothetical protein
MTTLVRMLVEARLLIADSRDGERTIEVAHEALFDGWDQMRSWIAENREYLLWRNRLRLRLEDWAASGRDEGGALQGVALQEALKWLARQADDLSDEEQAFIRWPLSDEFHLRAVIRSAQEILVSSADRVSRQRQREWLTALLLAEDAGAIASLLGSGSIPTETISQARVEAASLIARAGELDAAVATARGLDGTPRAEAAALVAEIAGTAGRPETVAVATALIGDEQLIRRALARAQSRGVLGSSGPFIIDCLSRVLALPPVVPSVTGPMRVTIDWPATLDVISGITSPALRAGVLTSAMSAIGERDRHDVVGSVLDHLEASVDGGDERFWHALIAVRITDTLGLARAFREAARIATRIELGGQRAHARALLARHHLSHGSVAEAVALCTNALDDISKSGTLEPGLARVLAVAGLLGHTGRSDEGCKLAIAALEITDLMNATSATMLARVAQALALCGAAADTARVLDRIPLIAGRHEARRSVARVLATHGHIDRLVTLAQSMVDPLEQADLLACGAEGDDPAVAVGHGAAADILRRALADSRDRRRDYARCLGRSAKILILSDRVPALLNALRATEGKHERVEAWIAVMERLAAAGLSADALTLVEESVTLIDALDDHDERARALAHVAGIIARCGRIEEAHRMARRCHLSDEQLGALTEILRSWIVRRRFPRAGDVLS